MALHENLSEAEFSTVISAAAKGDASAVGALWKFFNPMLLRYLRVATSSEWEDIASETWIGIAKSLPKFRGDRRAFESLMFTIARRRVVDVVRRSTSRPDLTPFVSEHQDAAPGPEELALAADALGELTDRLHLLPPAQAEVILLRVVSGLDVAEIARIVEKSPGAVRVLSHRGLSTLLEMENAHAAHQARRATPIIEEASTG